MIYDLVIVGMGPAGIGAAIYAKRAGLNILCLDQAMIGGYLNFIDRIDNYPGMYGVTGPDFAYKLFEHINSLNIQFKNKKVISILDGEIKKVITADEEFLCKNIIIATGRKSKKIGLDYEDELVGKGISYCALCDGAFFKNKVVAVVGGGNSALQEALHLSNITEKVYLIHRREKFNALNELIEKVTDKSNIVKVMSANIQELEINNNKLESKDITIKEITNIIIILLFLEFKIALF
jgi:thioredoxin reductase (NADPH)